MKNPKLLVIGADDAFFRNVYESLISRSLSVACYISHYPIERGSSLNSISRIDASCLYQSDCVASAYELDHWTVLDKDFLSEMLECERYFFSMMDRLSAKPQSITNRKIFFRELLRFFKTYFEKNTDITHVFFPRTPHFGWDIVLFFVAKHFGLVPLILQRTDFNKLYLIRSDWRCRLNLVISDVNGASLVADDLKVLLQGDSEFVKYSKQMNSRAKKALMKPVFFQNVGCFLRLFARWIRLFVYLFMIRKNRWSDSAFFCNANPNFAEKFLIYWTKYRTNKKCLYTYMGLSVTPDLNVPYVYYAMHFQPERSTQPEGMDFEDQFLAISILSAALPSGWCIYVKEHPRQFDAWPPDLRKMHARSANSYKEIARIPAVKFVSPDFDSDALISNSRMCSTITGSTGWEGMKKGKPAVLFGYSWYSTCDSCAVVHSAEEAAAAIAKLDRKGAAEVNQDIQVFLQSLRPHLISCFPGAFINSVSKADFQDFTVSLATGLIEYIHGERRPL